MTTVKNAPSAVRTLLLSPNAAVSTVFTDTLASIAKHSRWAFADLGLTPGTGTLNRYSVKPATRSASP